MAKMVTVTDLENGKVDLKTVDEATNEKKVVNPRWGNSFKSIPLIAQEYADNGMYRPFSKEADLLKYVPAIYPTVAKALDTFKIFMYEVRAPELKARWHDNGSSELDRANDFSKKYGFIISGQLTKCDYNSVDGSYLISHSKVQIAFGGGRSFVVIDQVDDLVIPASRMYFVDLFGAESGQVLQAHVSADDFNSFKNGVGAFVEDLKLPLFGHRGGYGGKGISGYLVRNGLPVNVDTTEIYKHVDEVVESPTKIAQRQGYQIEGRLTKCDYDSNTGNYTISHPQIRLFYGAGRSFVFIAAVADLVIPASRLYFVDVSESKAGSVVSGEITPTDYTSLTYGIGAFVDDLKIPLFGVRGGSSGNNIGGYLVRNGLPAPTIKTTSMDGIYFKKELDTASFYIKGTGSNYLKYGFNRTQVPFDGGVKPNSQSDLWRIVGCYEVDSRFNDVRGVPIVTTGEWECAIRETGGKADAVGGYHGDELQTNSFFVVDGRVYNQDAVLDTNVKELQFVQESIIYSCNTQIPICKHLKRYRITTNGIDLYQEFEWILATTITNAWLTMLPIKRLLNNTDGAQITDHAMRYPDYTVEDITSSGFERVYTHVSDGDSALIWGDDSGISAEVIFNACATEKAEMYIDNPTAYNKLYLIATGRGVHTTQIGEKWIQHSVFKLNTSN